MTGPIRRSFWPGAKGVNGDTIETLFFNNCYWIYNLETAASTADVLGKRDVAASWRARAAAIRTAVHKKFFKAEEQSYVNGFQAYLAAALVANVPPPDVREAVWKRLEEEILVHRTGHFHAGITGGYFLIEALLARDRPDLIFTMATKEDYPGFGDMLKKNATTMWESWEGDKSLLHSSYLWIGTWYSEGLAGIRPDPEVPGYRRFLVKPGVYTMSPLTWVKAEYESIRGVIRSEWKIEDGQLRLHVTVPPNTTALVFVPTSDPASVTEGARQVGQADGIVRLREEARHVVLRVEPGQYAFSAVF